MNSRKCQKRRVNRVSLEGFVSSVSRGGGMYLPMQLSPDFWYGQPKRLASGETTAASFAVRRALIQVQLPLRLKFPTHFTPSCDRPRPASRQAS